MVQTIHWRDSAIHRRDSPSPSDPSRLAVNLWYHGATQVTVLGVVIAYFVVLQQAGAISPDSKATVYLLTTVSVLFSALCTFFYRLKPRNGGAPLPDSFQPRGESFPLIDLAWDFANLALLTAVTGGADSVFLPLFVIGLLLGDVALSGEKRILLWGTFIATCVLGVSLPLQSTVRCALVNFDQTCSDALWDLPRAGHTLGLTVIFIPGALFSSYVLQRALGRRGVNLSEGPKS
jgi:hypothetical protein